MTQTPSPPPSVDLSEQRREYDAGGLLDANCPPAPQPLFRQWLTEALATETLDATAMSVATVDPTGQPSSRIVLLKDWDEKGLVFFTSYSSRKGSDLQGNPRAALLFHWQNLSRQVHVEGTVHRMTRKASTLYFSQRPRESQLAAQATSKQGTLTDRANLEELYRQQAQAWQGQEVEAPSNWGGYRLVPDRFEFWQGRPSRLHDRIEYCAQTNHGWERTRLTP